MKTRLCSLCSNLAFGLFLMAGTGMLVTSCENDLDELLKDGNSPEWLGSSIYSTLQERGNFKYTLRLINDMPGYASILSRTGSRTVFVANDEAWERFFKGESRNPWLKQGETMTYEDLTQAQKQWIINNSMINAAYLIERLSTTSSDGSFSEGQAMRREAFTSQEDTTKIYFGQQIQDKLSGLASVKNGHWGNIVGKEDTIHIAYARNDVAPIVHFTSDLRENKDITDLDMSYIVGGKGTAQPNDQYAADLSDRPWHSAVESENRTYIFDNPVIEQDITCQNGYIHVLGDVLVPPSNMADELEKQEDCSLFSSFLDRFTMPVVIGKTAGGDNIYRKVYFAAKGSYSGGNNGQGYEYAGNTGLSVDSAGNDMPTLAYDPTWHHNTYSSETYQQNMAAMFVPTDQALDEWWNSSTGQLVMNGKDSWADVDNNLLNVLINVHMKENFLNSTPSNFARILNDGNREQGITEGDVVRTVLANNGVIYIVNKVYTPDSYISVMAPLHNVEELTIMSRAVRCTDQTQYIPDGYGTYLNSMESQFTFLIPTNQALTDYHDPIYSQAAWAGNSAAYRQISFSYNASSSWASSTGTKYNISATYSDQNTGTTQTGDIQAAKGQNLLKDLLENCIIVMDSTGTASIQDKWNSTTGGYYQTKGGGMVYVDGFREGAHIYGGGNIDPASGEYDPATVTTFYNQSRYSLNGMVGSDGNGVSMALDKPVQPCRTSVLDALAKHEEFSEFYALMTDAGIDTIAFLKEHVTKQDSMKLYAPTYMPTSGTTQQAKGNIISFLGNYNYTLYAPTNEAMQIAYDQGLPRWKDISTATQESMGFATQEEFYGWQRTQCRKILNFIRTHFQDTSVATNGEAGYYKSQSFNSEEGVFYELYFDPSAGVVYTREQSGEQSHLVDPQTKVPASGNLSNIFARDYRFSAAPSDDGATISTSAHVLIHAINTPLFFTPLENGKRTQFE